MAALKIISVPQKYVDSLAYQQLLDYIMRADKTPTSYIDGFAVHPQYAAEEMQTVSAAYCFVHRRTSRFGSRFGSKRDFKNMVELFSQKSARKSSEVKQFRSFLWWTVQDSNL